MIIKNMKLVVGLLCCLLKGTPSLVAQSSSGVQQAKSVGFPYQPASGRAGDAIPYYWNGTYHVFFLKGSGWGHLSSRNLTEWTEQPDALDKGSDPAGPDGEAIWTGSIVENKGRFYLYYTGKNSRDPKGDQKVMMAESEDLIKWKKLPELTFYADGKIYWNKTINGAIDDQQIYHHQAFRDPHVIWNPEQKKWWMLLHAMLSDGTSPVMGLYTSDNLKDWTPQPPLVVYPVSVSGDCPEIFSMNNKWYIICADYHYMSAKSSTGPYDVKVKTFDMGDLRVPKTMYDGKRRLFTGWISDYQDHKDSAQTLWGGALSSIREFYTDSSGLLFQRPLSAYVKSFRRVRSKTKHSESRWEMKGPENFLLDAVIEAPADGRIRVDFRQKTGDSLSGYSLKIDPSSGETTVGGQYKKYRQIIPYEKGKQIRVQVFATGTVLECFINDKYCFSMRMYDWTGGNIAVYAEAGKIKIRNVTLSTNAKK